MTDTSYVGLTKTINEVGTAFEEFKKVNDERLKAVEEGKDSLATELGEKLGKIETDVSKFAEIKGMIETEQQVQRERIEELEARKESPGKTALDKIKDDHKDAFFNWIRNKGQSPLDEQKLQDVQKKLAEAKDVTSGTNAQGGFAMPEEIARDISILEKKFSPVRNLVKVVSAGSNDYKELVNIRGATSGWVGETGSRSSTNTPQLRERAPTFGELYAYPQASEWSLDDIFFDVAGWLSEEVAQEFAIAEGQAVISGNGTSRPTGMTDTTPVVTNDFASPLRSADAYEYVDSDTAESPANPGILPDKLIELIYTLNARYRSQAAWTMNSLTTAEVRKLKDANNQYLWQPGLEAGEPNRLLGFRHEAWEDMDDVGANNFPIAFGDFRRGYVLADRVGLRMTRDDVTNVGFVRFYVRRRVGGHVLNNDAIKFLRTAG